MLGNFSFVALLIPVADHCNVVFPLVHPPVDSRTNPNGGDLDLLPTSSDVSNHLSVERSGGAERGDRCAGSQLLIQDRVLPVARLLDRLRIGSWGMATVIEK